jgi:hypothetical protein
MELLTRVRPQEPFSRTLRNLTKLRTLSLALVKVPGEESIQAGAVRIALSNPRLTRFTIAFLQSSSSARRRILPYALPLTDSPRVIEQGRYVPVRDTHGIPVSLIAFETWYRFGGLGAKMSRRTVCDLRPSGHPDAARKGWNELLFERSPAGEEARMLVLSCWLLILAMWGILRAVVTGLVEAPWRAPSRGLNVAMAEH